MPQGRTGNAEVLQELLEPQHAIVLPLSAHVQRVQYDFVQTIWYVCACLGVEVAHTDVGGGPATMQPASSCTRTDEVPVSTWIAIRSLALGVLSTFFI